MELDDILNLWKEDSVIDKTELGDENLNIPKLHHKYLQILSKENLRMKQLESEKNRLKLDKYEYFSQGASKEHIDRGWKPLPKMIIKSEIPVFMEADEDIIKITLNISYQQEKIDMLKDIIKMIHQRNFQLKQAIEWQKFINGG